MTLALQIAGLIALVAFIIMAIYVIITLNSTTKLLKDTKTVVDQLSSNINSTITQTIRIVEELKTEVNQTLDGLQTTITEVNTTIKTVEGEIDNFIGVIDPFRVLIKNVYEHIAPPVNQASVFVAAATKAVSTFTDRFFRQKPKIWDVKVEAEVE